MTNKRVKGIVIYLLVIITTAVIFHTYAQVILVLAAMSLLGYFRTTDLRDKAEELGRKSDDTEGIE